jgi:3-(3-hydroxy-phenyl)propionate hydroxylase
MNTKMKTQVVVVGAGPCGVTIANYLGTFGIQTLVVERSAEILDYPRAVGADDEALRSWQGVGLAHDLLKDMIQNAPARYHNSKGECFAQVSPAEQPHGWPRRNLFIQPLTEKTLRKGLERFDCVTLMTGWEVKSLTQDDRGVELQAYGPNDADMTIEADYVVGADGGRSTIRGLVDIELTGMTHANKWLVIDVLDDPLDEPYTAIHCDPQRPSISIHLPYGYRRLEYQLMSGENEEQVLEPQNLQRLMRKHYPADVALPQIKRARIYLHHSRIANKFQSGRVFVAGDAAHLQPPFFGQGMNSGMRDATNIAWKLALVLKGAAHPRILASYDSERRDHAEAMVNFATWMGNFYKPHSRLTEWFRDLFFKSIQAMPSARDYILQLKFKPMSRYTSGIVVPLRQPAGKADPVGRMFMQPLVDVDGVTMKLDDVVGPNFVVLGLGTDPSKHLSEENLKFLDQIGARLLHVAPSRAPLATDNPGPGVLRVEDLQGKFRDWRMKHPNWNFIVVRPDRYVAAIGDGTEAARLVNSLQTLMR